MSPRPPSVDALAASLDDGRLPRALLVEIARQAVETFRRDPGGRSAEEVAAEQAGRLAARRPGKVVNATGVLLHTNLGRALLASEAAEAERMSSAGYSALEFDLGEGRRGGRGSYAHDLLRAVTGAEAALAVNNNAGALFLTIAALAGARAAVVSRGELIEIGGSFRLPDLMGSTGARLVEVGTTNRTRLKDYRKAVGPDTGMILKVHPSNYRIEGFTEEASYRDLAALAAERGIPFVADVGSGLLDARTPWLDGPPPAWLSDEPAVRQTVEAGADLVLFSGDKLLGGPQAGLIVGRAGLIEVIRSHPIARAVRIGGAALAALAVTLEMYAAGRAGEIPFWKMASLPTAPLEARSLAAASTIGPAASVEQGLSLPGAGSVPGKGIPGPIVVVGNPSATAWERLLTAAPPIVTRREPRGLIADLRTVDPGDDAHVADSIARACRS
ncbi:MAG: L-seryl-tRNA(Sec) selenium transferase [Actinobacteria bacterium]|nr:L-seryl-tRNA(Sec) selenium transferase [Actinomycetota bacterium]